MAVWSPVRRKEGRKGGVLWWLESKATLRTHCLLQHRLLTEAGDRAGHGESRLEMSWYPTPHQLPRQHWDSQRSWAQELEPWCLLVLQLHELTLNLSVVISAVGPGALGHGESTAWHTGSSYKRKKLGMGSEGQQPSCLLSASIG